MEIIFLFVLFFVKHFLADYPLQTEYMLRKSGHIYPWITPLLAHCAVHAVLTYIVLTFVVALGLFTIPLTGVLALVLMEFVAHFFIDAWKARLCNSKPNQTAFWIALGADQMFHYLTYALIIAMVI